MANKLTIFFFSQKVIALFESFSFFPFSFLDNDLKISGPKKCVFDNLSILVFFLFICQVISLEIIHHHTSVFGFFLSTHAPFWYFLVLFTLHPCFADFIWHFSFGYSKCLYTLTFLSFV